MCRAQLSYRCVWDKRSGLCTQGGTKHSWSVTTAQLQGKEISAVLWIFLIHVFLFTVRIMDLHPHQHFAEENVLTNNCFKSTKHCVVFTVKYIHSSCINAYLASISPCKMWTPVIMCRPYKAKPSLLQLTHSLQGSSVVQKWLQIWNGRYRSFSGEIKCVVSSDVAVQAAASVYTALQEDAAIAPQIGRCVLHPHKLAPSRVCARNPL